MKNTPIKEADAGPASLGGAYDPSEWKKYEVDPNYPLITPTTLAQLKRNRANVSGGGEADKLSDEEYAKQRVKAMTSAATMTMDQDAVKKYLQLRATGKGNEIPTDELNKYFGDNVLNDYVGMRKLNHRMLYQFLADSYNAPYKVPQIIFGEPGFGKSAGVVEFVRSAADAMKKMGEDVEFVHFNHAPAGVDERVINSVTKMDVIRNPSKYFVFIDIRLAQCEATDFQGVPDINSSHAFNTTKKSILLHLATLPGARGVLFLDEINQAQSSVQSALFSILNFKERTLGETKITPDVMIVGAANPGEYWSKGNNVFNSVLRSRVGFCALFLTPPEWFAHAEKTGIHPMLIEFVRANPQGNFYYRPKDNESRPEPFGYPTPRVFEEVSQAMYLAEEKYKTNEQYRQNGDPKYNPNITQGTVFADWIAAAQDYAGEDWAKDLVSFITAFANFNWDEAVRNPDKFSKDVSPSDMLAFVSFIRQKSEMMINNDPELKNPETLQFLNDIIKILVKLDPEVMTLFLNYLRLKNEAVARKLLQGTLSANLIKDPKIRQEWTQMFNVHYSQKMQDIMKQKMGQAPTQAYVTGVDPAAAGTQSVSVSTTQQIPTNNPDVDENYAESMYLSLLHKDFPLTEEAEQAILKSPKYACLYSINVLKQPYTNGEQIILQNEEAKSVYLQYFPNQTGYPSRFKNAFKTIMEALDTTEVPALPAEGSVEPSVDTSGLEKYAPIGLDSPFRTIIKKLMAKMSAEFGVDWNSPNQFENCAHLNQNFKKMKISLTSSLGNDMYSRVVRDDIDKAEDVTGLLMNFLGKYGNFYNS